MARVYCDHRLHRIGSGPVRVRHNRLAGAMLSVNFMEYGAKAMIAPGPLDTFYLFQFPLSGYAHIASGGDSYVIGGGRGGVLNPDAETNMIWEEGCAQLMLQLDRRAVDRMARQNFGLPEDRSVRFVGSGDLRLGSGLSLLNLLHYVISESESGNRLVGGTSLMASQIEQTLILGLLENLPNNLRLHASSIAPNAGPTPRIVRMAEDYMQANLREALTVGAIAEAIGTSVRSLQMAFRTYRERSPMEVMRDMRLDQAWTDLSNPTRETTVTDVAMEWGFIHLGRFAEQYRKKFGCTPIETLRQANS